MKEDLEANVGKENIQQSFPEKLNESIMATCNSCGCPVNAKVVAVFPESVLVHCSHCGEYSGYKGAYN